MTALDTGGLIDFESPASAATRLLVQAQSPSEHIAAALEQASALGDARVALDADLGFCLAQRRVLTDADVMRRREHFFARAEALSEQLRPDSDRLFAAAPAHVASVLRATGPGGFHVSLFRRLAAES